MTFEYISIAPDNSSADVRAFLPSGETIVTVERDDAALTPLQQIIEQVRADLRSRG